MYSGRLLTAEQRAVFDRALQERDKPAGNGAGAHANGGPGAETTVQRKRTGSAGVRGACAQRAARASPTPRIRPARCAPRAPAARRLAPALDFPAPALTAAARAIARALPRPSASPARPATAAPNVGRRGHWNAYYDQASATYALDKNDPNYDSEDDAPMPSTPVARGRSASLRGEERLAEYKRGAADIVTEYFSSGDATEAIRAFKELRMPALAHNFVKRAISMSLDKAARERELIAVLLCALCGEGLYTESVERGFMMLMESIEDLELDVPAAKTELSVFVARAVADDILPMDFLSKSRVMSKPEAERTPVEDVLAQAHGRLRREGSLASELSSVAEVYAYWGGGESEIARAKRVIAEALAEYIDTSDVAEISMRLQGLRMPHFMHEAVKSALTLAIEKDARIRDLMLELLERLQESGHISTSQMAKGFARMQERTPDLELDVPGAGKQFEALVRAAREAEILPSKRRAERGTDGPVLPASVVAFKARSVDIAREYFSACDTLEAVRCLREAVADAGAAEDLVKLFVKRLVVLALDRGNRERELSALLLSALYDAGVDAPQLRDGYSLLVDAVEDLSLDVPDAVQQLALFLARACVDDVVPPAYVASLATEQDGAAAEVGLAAAGMLRARHGAERVLQAWGGAGAAHASAAHAVSRIDECLAEYASTADVAEASKCLRESQPPFFMHEVVKRALTLAIERRDAKVATMVIDLLAALSESGLVTVNQMAKGFMRVHERVPDLELDVPDAKEAFIALVGVATDRGMVPRSLSAQLDPRGGTAEEASAGESADADDARAAAERASSPPASPPSTKGCVAS